MTSGPTIDGILLDIEGTTTPIAFVHQVLFPYARAHVKSFLATNLNSPALAADVAQLRNEYALDLRQQLTPPAQVNEPKDAGIDSLVSYVQWLIDLDRKSPGLKSLQGKIWEKGYLDGALRAPLFPDVLPAIERWQRAGLKIAIFSSGSTFAQKLLFAHTQSGDVSQFIDNYFDRTIGAKTAGESYARIAAALDLVPQGILFISDVVAELDAAVAAGLQTILSVRPGNQPQPVAHNHRVILTFDEIK